MIISLINTKGGSGKTTIAVNLARALNLRNLNTLLVDSDPQGSARDWHAQSDGKFLNVIGLDRPTLDKDIHKISYGYDYILVDGAPHLSLHATKAIICSDLVLIPVQPSPYDVWATKDIVAQIKERQAITNGSPKAAFIVSRQIVNTKIGKEVRETLNEYELPVFNSGTFQRVIYPTSAAIGLSVFDIEGSSQEAPNEINNIVDEILKFIQD